MELSQEVKDNIRIIQDFPQAGISFKDFSQIFQKSALCNKVITAMAEPYRDKVDVVCGIESRGFILGLAIALELGVPFVMVRKKGKLPPPVVSASYQLEYGEATLEMVEGQINEGARVMIHDDVLATGGTAAACAELVKKLGAVPHCFTFLIELDFLNGRERIDNENVTTIIGYAS